MLCGSLSKVLTGANLMVGHARLLNAAHCIALYFGFPNGSDGLVAELLLLLLPQYISLTVLQTVNHIMLLQT